MVNLEYCSVGKKTGNIGLQESDISVLAGEMYTLYTWKLSLEDKTLIISRKERYSSEPPELLYFTLQRS